MGEKQASLPMREKQAEQIITSAHCQKLIKPAETNNIVLAPSVNTANRILWLIQSAGADGLLIAQLVEKVALHVNTVRVYCQILHKLGYIVRETEPSNSGRGKGSSVVYRSIAPWLGSANRMDLTGGNQVCYD
jgi:hypothetical protein